MTTPFEPVAGKHAIELCVAGVIFPQPIGDEAFAAVSELAQTVARDNDLPRISNLSIPEALINIGFPAITPANGGLVLQRFAADGNIDAELRCERQSIVLRTRNYNRWADLQAYIERVLLPFIRIYTSEIPAIHSVRLQYDDRFNRPMNSPKVCTAAMFRNDTRWLAISDRNTIEYWHSHNGIFISEGGSRRELVNVNATVNEFAVPAGVTDSVSLSIMVGKFYDIIGQPPLVVESAQSGEEVLKLLIACHDRHKEILAEVLTDEYLIAIGAKD